jgi:membrane protein DedA with SNARE-associated domain/rhodanese-related sulfurtransferase
MDTWTSAIAQHGYVTLSVLVFLDALGLPVPAAVALLVAGALAARGVLQLQYLLGVSVLAMLAGDTLLYLLGRYTGWWLLGVLCRISLNPESCILRSADSFYRRGRQLLVYSKFLPGINTMAPPLAGSMNMGLAQFLILDLAGTVLYVGAYFAVGFLFSNALGAMVQGYQAAGRILGAIIIALIAAYLLYLLWLWLKQRGLPPVTLADPTEAERASQGGAVIYDVRSHGYFDPKATRIRGSRRLDPNALNQPDTALPGEQAIYLYCTCARQATSARVARELQVKLKGKTVRIAVIRGGLRAWTRAGLPVEPVPPADMAALPLFR